MEGRGRVASLLLGSASPRRRQLLQRLGVDFDVDASDLAEVPRPDETPSQFARRMAREKALDVAARHPRRFVLAADTVVTVDGRIFGKPAAADDARRMLHTLSGRTHQVLTAVALIDPAGHFDELIAVTDVDFRRLDTAEIEAYVATGEPLDKAGAYAIQGGAAVFVTGVRGSYTNVVGLPLDEVEALLRRHLPARPPAGEAR
jgi:septum formation protein